MKRYERVDVFPILESDRPYSKRICIDDNELNEAQPLLGELQDLIGGYITAIYPEKRPEYVWICDEDGIPKHLPRNENIWRRFKVEVYGAVIELPRTTWEL